MLNHTNHRGEKVGSEHQELGWDIYAGKEKVNIKFVNVPLHILILPNGSVLDRHNQQFSVSLFIISDKIIFGYQLKDQVFPVLIS